MMHFAAVTMIISPLEGLIKELSYPIYIKLNKDEFTLRRDIYENTNRG